MAGWRVLSPGQVAEVTGRLAGLRWSWSRTELDRVVAVLGWRLAAPPRPAGAVLSTGLEPFNGLAELRWLDEGAGAIVVKVTDAADDHTESVNRRRDAFAMAVGAVTGVLEAPGVRHPGPEPEVRWHSPASVLRVSDAGVFVELSLLSPRYVELLDEFKTRPDEDFDEGQW